ncbi:MAG: hypothetical protein Q8S84_01470 [bacterium]|nr:hypothetical protein [bacterium]MDP3380237.1 hypothetical protein [bacterium]
MSYNCFISLQSDISCKCIHIFIILNLTFFPFQGKSPQGDGLE